MTFEEGTYAPLSILRTETRQINSTWENRFGRNRIVRDRAVEVTIHCQERAEPNRSITLVLRAYDDGFAFRYVIPEQKNQAEGQTYVLTEENTHFRFASDLKCWGSDNLRIDSSHEAAFDKTTLSQLRREGIYALPLVVTGNFGYAALAEAEVTNWPKAHFRSVPGENAVSVGLAPRKDGCQLATGSLPLKTPWRVILLGKKAIDLVNNSGVILNLNPPGAIADTDWITPGVTSWDWWGHSNIDLTTDKYKEKVDLSAAMGWPYTTLDVPWYGIDVDTPRETVWIENEPLKIPQNQQADILSGSDKVDFDEALRYAKEKGIRVFVWVHSSDLRVCGEEKAFRFFSEKGVAGLKIDFIERDDQETVEWTYRIIQLAAQYHLLINFHGTFPPSGICRTWPNILTREGIMGNEFNKWSCNVTPTHSVTLPFTRYLLGHGDFTPGGFVNRHSEQFRPQNAPSDDVPQMGTRALALAQCVLYDSPLMTLCDTPKHYFDQPGADMLKNLPACWDESIALAGEIGEYIVMARRSGDKWYLSAMNAQEEKTVEVSLDFLPEGTTWSAEFYTDAPDSGENAESLLTSRGTFKAGQTISIPMAHEGGWNAVMTRETR